MCVVTHRACGRGPSRAAGQCRVSAFESLESSTVRGLAAGSTPGRSRSRLEGGWVWPGRELGHVSAEPEVLYPAEGQGTGIGRAGSGEPHALT